ncbi:PTS sugar transporter subunit IIB [Propionibacterium sp.]|uniref:PTS sugar transporter subunit IIB n=1 Tax=Propionibacterium sp. TaxID=1977903 RepID=UPI0039EA2202
MDERLIHGQIAMAWCRALQIQGILVANDEAATNNVQQMALKMAAPPEVKVLIKSVSDAVRILTAPAAADKRLLVLVRTVHDALHLVERVGGIESVNIGNVGKTSGSTERTQLSSYVLLTPPELADYKTLVELTPEAFLQPVPTAEKTLARDALTKLK